MGEKGQNSIEQFRKEKTTKTCPERVDDDDDDGVLPLVELKVKGVHKKGVVVVNKCRKTLTFFRARVCAAHISFVV